MKYLTINEVCEALGISREKLRSMEKSGQVPTPVLVGKTKRWQAEELEAFLKENSKLQVNNG